MCQTLRTRHQNRYKSEDDFRWKQITLNPVTKEFKPRFHKAFGTYKKGSWMEAFTKKKWNQFVRTNSLQYARKHLGFHVFVDRHNVGEGFYAFAKVQVKGFSASGTWNWNDDKRCETYRYMRLVEVYSIGGKLVWKAKKQVL